MLTIYSGKVSRLHLICLAFYLIVFSSCYNYRIATQAQEGSEINRARSDGFFWGLAHKPPSIRTPLCDSLESNGMSQVTMKSNFGYSLITVLTLGIWSPMKVEWKCGKPCKKTDTL